MGPGLWNRTNCSVPFGSVWDLLGQQQTKVDVSTTFEDCVHTTKTNVKLHARNDNKCKDCVHPPIRLRMVWGCTYVAATCRDRMSVHTIMDGTHTSQEPALKG
jgi:hypothetical protein